MLQFAKPRCPRARWGYSVAVFMALFSAAPAAPQQIAYSAEYPTFNVKPGLFITDLESGLETLVGRTERIYFQSLALGPYGTLFGIGRFLTFQAEPEDHLYSINRLTGELTVVAGPLQASSYTSLSIDTDGGLWIVRDGVLFYGGPVLDLEETGLVEVGAPSLSAIAHSNGVLYGIRRGTPCCPDDWHLVTLAPETGETKNLASLPVHGATFTASMSADQNGVLWVLTEWRLPISPPLGRPNQLFRINPETGIVTIVRTPKNRRGLAVVLPAQGIPSIGIFWDGFEAGDQSMWN